MQKPIIQFTNETQLFKFIFCYICVVVLITVGIQEDWDIAWLSATIIWDAIIYAGLNKFAN